MTIKGGVATVPSTSNQVEVEFVADANANDVNADVRVVATLASVSHSQSFRLNVIRQVQPLSTALPLPTPPGLNVAKRPDIDLLFEEDFKDSNKRTFVVLDKDNGHQGYENGQYVLSLRRGPIRAIWITLPDLVSDFEFETKLQFTGMANEAKVSIGFRDDDQPKKLRMLWWDIYNSSTRLDRQIFDLAKPGTPQSNQILWRGNNAGFLNPGWNVLKLRAHGATVELTTNDILMRRESVGGPTYKPGTRRIEVALTHGQRA